METAYSQALHRENTSLLFHPPSFKASGSPVPGKEQLKKGTWVEPRAVAQSSTKKLGGGWQGSLDHHHPLSIFPAFAPFNGSAALFPPRPALGEMLCPFPPIPLVADASPSLEVVGSALFPVPQKPGSLWAALPKQAAEAGKGVQEGKCCATEPLPFSLSFPGATCEKPGQQEKDGAGDEILECRLIKLDSEVARNK